MDASGYTSQQEAITRKAKEKGIAFDVLNTVFDQKIDSIVQDYPGTRPSWRLGRAEYLVWEHFFPNEPFPGSLTPSDSGLSKMEKNTKKGTDRYGSMYKRDMNNEWVHDMYRADSPACKENIAGSRRPDYYDGPAKRRVGEIDSYKPALGDNGKHRDDSRDIDSYRPLSRDGKEHYDDGRHGINKPTDYKSHMGRMIEKAFAAGVSSDSYYRAYYRYGQKAKEEKPAASAYWLLWRQEWMICHKFFPGQGFIGAEPKLEPTTRDTEPSNFSLMDGSNLWSILKSSPSYGRLTKESDPAKSTPTGPSNTHQQPPPVTASSSSTHGVRNNLQHHSQPARASNSTQDSQNNFQPSQPIATKAGARGVSMERIVATYKEKRNLVQDHFPEQIREWQRWFVEATVWGQLFKDAPFPAQEPRFDQRSEDNKLTINSFRDKNSVISYTHQEKVMEQMAIKKGIRKEFYQYLNTARHDAIAVHPKCTCHARHFFADRLTWRKFFKEPFPVAWPRHDHSQGCGAYVRPDPSSSQTQAVTAPLKSPIVKSEEREALAQVPQRTLLGRSIATAKAPGEPPIVKSEKSSAVVLPPQGSTAAVKASAPHGSVASVSTQSQPLLGRPTVVQQGSNQRPVVRLPPPQLPTNAHPQTAESRSASCSPGFASTQAPAPSSSPQGQRINIKFPPGQTYSEPLQGQEAKAQPVSREVSASPAQASQEMFAPVSIMAALTQVRNDQPIPDGAVVMQNMDSTICNCESVAQMFRCLQAEDAASITFISNGLKCHFRYKRNWNNDLLLWVEPFTLGDTAAFSAGHLFLKGWVQRNLGFGVVQPSFYWSEIQNTASFKHAATAPVPTSEAVSPMKSHGGENTLSAENLDRATDNSAKAADAVLMIRGDCVENVPCSRAALKNLAFSFVIDSSKEKVEHRLRCTFSLNEPKGFNKTGGQELGLAVKPLLGTEREGFEKATRFLRAWALRAMQSTPCKASTFLVCSEGLQILGKSPSAMPANDVPGKRSGDPGKTRSSFNASDLDLMLSEETAKAEGSSRLVLDEVTGEVVSLRALLKKTLYRASAKILESSAIAENEDEEGEEDDEVQVFGTDGQMKDMGGGKFVVVKTQKGFVNGKRKIEEDPNFGERAEKRVCTSRDKGVEYKKSDAVAEMAGVTGGAKQNGIVRSAASPLENGSRAVETSEPVNGKRKAEEADLGGRAEQNSVDLSAASTLENDPRTIEASEPANENYKAEEVEFGDRAEPNGVDESAATPLENGSGGVKTSEPVNGKRKAEEVELDDRAEKKVCIQVVALPVEDGGR